MENRQLLLTGPMPVNLNPHARTPGPITERDVLATPQSNGKFQSRDPLEDLEDKTSCKYFDHFLK